VTQHREFAKSAAAETAPRDSVGPFIDSVDEGDSVFTYRFECKLKGYRDWRWSVVIFAPDNQQPTVSEVLLMPGEGSLIAPDWVPWSERLADYRALQAELEAQAALEAEDSEEDSEEDPNDSDDFSEASFEDESASSEETLESGESAKEEQSALSNSDQTDEAEDDANTAGKRPKRLFGWRKPRVGKKNKK
jgi:hypothetical protein